MATTFETPRLGDIEQGIISPCHSDATAVETFSSCGESCTADNDDHNTRSSSASASASSSSCSCYLSECSVEDIESGGDNGGSEVTVVDIGKVSVHLSKVKRDCRICHLSFDGSDPESGLPIELGCSCKEDLAAAHRHCAEAWFKIRGNKTCEICGSTARNVVGVNEVELIEQWNEANDNVATTPAVGPHPSETRHFWQGHRFLNFLLACMVFAFVISWLFHFNVPS